MPRNLAGPCFQPLNGPSFFYTTTTRSAPHLGGGRGPVEEDEHQRWHRDVKDNVAVEEELVHLRPVLALVKEVHGWLDGHTARDTEKRMLAQASLLPLWYDTRHAFLVHRVDLPSVLRDPLGALQHALQAATMAARPSDLVHG